MREEPAYLSLSTADMPAVEGAPDDQEPSPERQADLRKAYDANLAVQAPPYSGAEIRTLGELQWILTERGWSGEFDDFQIKYGLAPPGACTPPADLRGVVMPRANLKGVHLRRANLNGANLIQANLAGADLVNIQGRDANFGFADFTGALLVSSDLSDAHLRGATLREVQLRFAQLGGTRLYQTDLRGANLTGAQISVSTVLAESLLDTHTQLADVVWNSVPLAGIAWAELAELGDEHLARTRSGPLEGSATGIRAPCATA
jgi:uncharacterized protein YjbI with pentapeptide repeats